MSEEEKDVLEAIYHNEHEHDDDPGVVRKLENRGLVDRLDGSFGLTHTGYEVLLNMMLAEIDG